MRYLFALLCPPLGIFLCGRPFLALFSMILLPFYFPSALVAILVVSNFNADRRNRELMGSIGRQTKELNKASKKHHDALIAEDRAARVAASSSAARPSTSVAAISPPAPTPPSAPRKPRLTAEGVKALLGSIKEGAIAAKEGSFKAYQELPEWAQPITWGLAAGTPLSIALAAFILLRR